jgi:hypothetical protein
VQAKSVTRTEKQNQQKPSESTTLVLKSAFHPSRQPAVSTDEHHSFAVCSFPSMHALTLLYAGLLKRAMSKNDQPLEGYVAQGPTAHEQGQSMTSSSARPSQGNYQRPFPDRRASYNRPSSDSGPEQTSQWEILRVSLRSVIGAMRPQPCEGSRQRRHTDLRLALSGPATLLASRAEKTGLSSGRRKNDDWAGTRAKEYRLIRSGMSEPSAK